MGKCGEWCILESDVVAASYALHALHERAPRRLECLMDDHHDGPHEAECWAWLDGKIWRATREDVLRSADRKLVVSFEFERKLLDHGYLRYVEHWGSDERIVEAARMSTQKGFEGWGDGKLFCPRCPETVQGPGANSSSGCLNCGEQLKVRTGDEKLLKYLWDHRHATPFEMAGVVVEVQAPIFVFREWHRHRTQSYNEMSARYAPLPDLNYVPTVERLMMGGGHLTKQAGTVKGAAELTEKLARQVQDVMLQQYARAEEDYSLMLGAGVPKELARLVMPVGRYSRMRASANLRNWLAFLTLRQDKAAQWEIRQYADALSELLATLFPRTHALYAGGIT